MDHFDNPKVYFKKQYFEVLDVITAELEHRFQQERGMPIAALLEQTLLDAAKGSFSEYPNELQLYHNDVDNDRLIVQLKMLPDLVRTYNEQNPATRIKEITKLSTLCQIMKDICSSKSLFSEISTLLQIAHTIPDCRTYFLCFAVSKIISPINHVTGTIKSLYDITHLQERD